MVLAGIGAPGLTFLTFHIVKHMLRGKKEKRWAALNYITNVMWALIGISIFVNAQSNARVLRTKIKKIETLAHYLNADCSDSFMVLPEELYKHYAREEHLSWAWLGLSILIAALAIANFIVSLVYSRKRTLKARQWGTGRRGGGFTMHSEQSQSK